MITNPNFNLVVEFDGFKIYNKSLIYIDFFYSQSRIQYVKHIIDLVFGFFQAEALPSNKSSKDQGSCSRYQTPIYLKWQHLYHQFRHVTIMEYFLIIQIMWWVVHGETDRVTFDTILFHYNFREAKLFVENISTRPPSYFPTIYILPLAGTSINYI